MRLCMRLWCGGRERREKEEGEKGGREKEAGREKKKEGERRRRGEGRQRGERGRGEEREERRIEAEER